MSKQELLKPLSEQARSLCINSLYEHYKGNRYKILAVARHSETLEELVVYQALYGEHGIWVRPVEMFLETILIDGQLKARFELVRSALNQ